MSTSLPNSPMMLDSTGRSIVQKLQGIIDALGGGGGTMAMPPEYDPELEDYTKGYYRGQYVTYQDSLYKCNDSIYVYEGHPSGAFDSTKWDEITDLFNEFFQFKPGRITDYQNYNEVFNWPGNTVSGQYAHAEGMNTVAANCSHAEGQATQATGSGCHAEGSSTNAGGSNGNSYCHAEGYGTRAEGYCSHAEGSTSTASSNYCHAEGYNTIAGDSNGSAYAAHAEGYYSRATGSYSHAECYNTKATESYSHAEGYYCEANGMYSHVEGMTCKANGYCTRASGMQSVATGSNSEACGYNSLSEGQYSKADGYYCLTRSIYEHAVGRYNKSYYDWNVTGYWEGGNYTYDQKVRIYDDPNGQKVYRCTNYQGVTNAPATMDMNDWEVYADYYDESETLLFEVGNGNGYQEQYRSNAFEVYKSGKVKIGGQQALALDPPSADGTYTLKCTVSDGTVTYSWVADPV